MNAQERAVMQQALAFTMRDFATVRDFEAARAVLHDALCAILGQQVQEPVSEMTAHRAIYFMERFKREEKLLGPNEQAALDFVISMLEKQAEPVVGRINPETGDVTSAAQRKAADWWCPAPRLRPRPEMTAQESLSGLDIYLDSHDNFKPKRWYPKS